MNPAARAASGGPNVLTLRTSMRLQRLLIVLHLMIACAIVASVSTPWIVLGATLVVIVSLRSALARAAAVDGHELVLGPQLGVRRSGADTTSCPVADSHSFGWALWLYWRSPEGSEHRLLLLQDSLVEPLHWRRLKAWSAHRLEASP